MLIKLSDKEIQVINRLNHPLYTIEFLQEWINRKDNIFVNAPSALQAMGAKGYYQAIQQICKLEGGLYEAYIK